jgi:hypothetical protein
MNANICRGKFVPARNIQRRHDDAWITDAMAPRLSCFILLTIIRGAGRYKTVLCRLKIEPNFLLLLHP